MRYLRHLLPSSTLPCAPKIIATLYHYKYSNIRSLASVPLPSLIIRITSFIPAVAISALITRTQETGRPRSHTYENYIASIFYLQSRIYRPSRFNWQTINNIWKSEAFVTITLFFLRVIFYERMRLWATGRRVTTAQFKQMFLGPFCMQVHYLDSFQLFWVLFVKHISIYRYLKISKYSVTRLRHERGWIFCVVITA
jgi:hypothetical protein